MDGLLASSTFWVLVAFVIFAYLAGRPAWKAIAKGLDERAEKIRQDIEQAQKLRADAQAALAQYQRKQRDAQKEADALLAHAREEAERLARQAREELEVALKRREQQAMEKIAQAEAAALQQVRELAVEVAVSATERLLVQNMDADRRNALVDAAIKDLPARLH